MGLPDIFLQRIEFSLQKVLTASNGESGLDILKKENISIDFISKPFTPDQLRIIVQRAM